MSIRALDHNGTAHQLSARMTTDFQSELRRIGEAPSPPTVNLWVSNQTPEELLEILRRMPDRPADDRDKRDRADALHPEVSILRDSNEDGSGDLWESGHVYNSVYQRETGHIFADPCGEGELINRSGRTINLRDEQEREREEWESRNGREDEGR